MAIHLLNLGQMPICLQCEWALRLAIKGVKVDQFWNLGLIHTGCTHVMPANETCCCQWEYSHCSQATSKEKCSILQVLLHAHHITHPVWIRPKILVWLKKLFSNELLCIGHTPNFDAQNLRKKSATYIRKLTVYADSAQRPSIPPTIRWSPSHYHVILSYVTT